MTGQRASVENGYAATTTTEIAARVGATRSALAFHFPAKASVSVAIVEECHEQWSRLVDVVAPRHENALDTVGELPRLVAVQIRDDPIVRATVRLQAEKTHITEPLSTPYVGWIAGMTDLFATADARGQLRNGQNPAALARAAVAGFQRVQHVSGTPNSHDDVVERADEFWWIVRVGIETEI